MAKRQDITIDQDSVFQLKVQVKDKETGAVRNLTGYTARMHIKRNKAEVATVAEFATGGDGIVITELTGTVVVTMADEETDAFTWSSGVYDLKIISPGGSEERILEGGVKVSKKVTA